ncbi:hypothetical protein Tco_1413918 [Tanacetum coccineum]
MTTLAEFIIIAGADNRPPMLEKSLYDSWKSRMEHYIENRENGRMILSSVQNGPLIWPTVTEEDGTTRTKTYAELSATEKIQANCDCKAVNIVLQGLTVHVFNQGDDLIACLNKAMTFLTPQGSLQPTINLELPLIRETKPLFKTAGLQCNKFRGGKGKVILVLVIRVMLLLLGETTQAEWQGLLNESKEKENKYMENEIDLKNKIKELDNIVYKVGQSAQTVHMLTKPQVFYDNSHKQALGYQNLFYLKKVQRIKPTLYDGSVISSEHVAMLVIDDDETLILEEVKLSAEQAFWFHMSNPTTESSDTSPVKVDVPRELPKVSLVNESLKKLKFHLA